jgi:hypothetical protein
MNIADENVFIAIRHAAPPKPALGAPCNGCDSDIETR